MPAGGPERWKMLDIGKLIRNDYFMAEETKNTVSFNRAVIMAVMTVALMVLVWFLYSIVDSFFGLSVCSALPGSQPVCHPHVWSFAEIAGLVILELFILFGGIWFYKKPVEKIKNDNN
jgi:hypothetical protein